MCAGAVEKSAGCYELVVEMHSKLGNFLECAMAYKDAGSMFEKADRPNGALPAPSLRPALQWAHGLGCRAAECCRCLDEAKGLYAQEGRLSECAKLAKRRAEIFEKAEIIDLMLECYEEAAELFDGEDQKGETRNCKLKIAHYKALGMTALDTTSAGKKFKLGGSWGIYQARAAPPRLGAHRPVVVTWRLVRRFLRRRRTPLRSIASRGRCR